MKYNEKLNHFYESLVGARQGGKLSDIGIKKLAYCEKYVPTLTKEYILKKTNVIQHIEQFYKEII